MGTVVLSYIKKIDFLEQVLLNCFLSNPCFDGTCLEDTVLLCVQEETEGKGTTGTSPVEYPQ